jgi:hypothetical protein
VIMRLANATISSRAAASQSRAARPAGAAVQGPGEVYATSALAVFGARLGPPKAIVRETVRKVAKADLRSEFRSQSRETIGPAPRADAANDPDDDKGVMGEAIPAVHAGLFYLCSQHVKRRTSSVSPPSGLRRLQPSALRKHRSFPTAVPHRSDRLWTLAWRRIQHVLGHRSSTARL